MRNRISHQAYGLACLAIFVAVILMACETPAPGVAAPTVSEDITDISSLAADTTKNVGLSNAFKGEKLTFSVRSNNLGVAVPTIAADNRSIVIRAIGPGTATITVTATNSGGNVAQSFSVTVPTPTTPTTPTTPPPTTPEEPEIDADYTIKLGESVKHTLAAGQVLQEPASDGVKVEPSADGETNNVWIIVAKKKGTHKVTILSAGKSVGAITVEVPNSRPIRQDAIATTDLKNPLITLTAATPPSGTPVILEGTPVNGTPTPIDSYFTDADDDDTTFYRIESAPPWFLIETEDGFLKDVDLETAGFQMGYEVLQKVVNRVDTIPYEFTVTLYASDGEEESTRPVVIEFNVAEDLPPRSMTGTTGYQVNQAPVTGDFTNATKVNPPKNRLDVGPRRGVVHSVTFKGSSHGFVFSDTETGKLTDSRQGLLGGEDGTGFSVSVGNVFYQVGSSSPTAVGDTSTALLTEGTENQNFFIIKSTSSVIVTTPITIGDDSVVSFELKETGSGGGSIIIEHHVWALSRKPRPAGSGGTPPAEERASVPTTKKIFRKTLTINVVTCSSPPDPISDCP